MKLSLDVVRKGLEARKHPGLRRDLSLVSLALQGLPYLAGATTRVRPPMTLYWNLNSVCNLRCKMCDVGTFNEESNFYKNLRIDRKLHEIEPARFESVVEEVAPYGTQIALNGTEPLMYKPLGQVVAAAARRGLVTSVTTGAYTLPDRATELAEAGLHRLNVSLDGPPDLHNRIRGRKDVFDRAVTGIQRFVAESSARGRAPEVYLNYTISNLNHDALVAYYESIRELPVHRINFVNMNFVTKPMADAHNASWGDKYAATVNCLSDEVDPSRVDVDVLWEQVEALTRRKDPRITFLPFFGKEELRTYYREPGRFLGHIPCMSTWVIAQVMADGVVIPYTRCYYVPLGNINERPFLEIWRGAPAAAWRKDLRHEGRFPACTRCDMVY